MLQVSSSLVITQHLSDCWLIMQDQWSAKPAFVPNTRSHTSPPCTVLTQPALWENKTSSNLWGVWPDSDHYLIKCKEMLYDEVVEFWIIKWRGRNAYITRNSPVIYYMFYLRAEGKLKLGWGWPGSLSNGQMKMYWTAERLGSLISVWTHDELTMTLLN